MLYNKIASKSILIIADNSIEIDELVKYGIFLFWFLVLHLPKEIYVAQGSIVIR